MESYLENFYHPGSLCISAVVSCAHYIRETISFAVLKAAATEGISI